MATIRYCYLPIFLTYFLKKRMSFIWWSFKYLYYFIGKGGFLLPVTLMDHHCGKDIAVSLLFNKEKGMYKSPMYGLFLKYPLLFFLDFLCWGWIIRLYFYHWLNIYWMIDDKKNPHAWVLPYYKSYCVDEKVICVCMFLQ